MLRKFFVGILFSLFVLLFVPVSLAFGVYTTFLDQNFYKGDFVELVYQFAIDELPRNANLADLPLSEEKLKKILFEVFTRDDVLFMVESFFDQLKDLNVPQSGNVDFQISLDWLREKNELVANKTALALVEDLPVCTTENVPSEAFPKCIPEDVSKIDFQSRVQQALDRELFSDIPNEIALNFTFPGNISGNLFEYFDDLIVKILTIGLFVLIFILGLMSLVIFAPWNAVLKKLFRALFFASLHVFVLLIVMLIIPADIFSDYGIDAYLRIYSFFVSALTSNMFYYLFPLILFAFLGWMGIIFYERKVLKSKSDEPF